MNILKNKLNANALKYIAIVAMLIDHIGATIPIVIGGVAVNDSMRVIGRLTMPIMCYFIAEGYVHTRSKPKYALRLLIFALVSEIPFRLLFAGHGSNVGFTLLAGLCAAWAFDALSAKFGSVWGRITGVGAVWLICWAVSINLPFLRLSTDYGALGVLAIFLTTRMPKSRRFILPPLMIVLPNAMVAFNPSYDMMFRIFGASSMVLAAVVTLLLLYFYNGERGRGGVLNKYLFYIFYPAHILVIYVYILVTGIPSLIQ